MLSLALILGWGLWVLVASLHFSRAKRMWFTLGLLTALVVPGTVIEAQWRLNEHAIEDVARELTGRSDVEVYCQRFADDLVDTTQVLGYVPFGEDGNLPTTAYLRRETCNALADYRNDPAREPDAATAMAVHVLTHEAMHLAGLSNEAQAECAAQQRDARTAQLLGATTQQGQRLAALYLATGYPRLPADYRSGDCIDGGAWDEDLDNAPWVDQVRGRGYAAPMQR